MIHIASSVTTNGYKTFITLTTCTEFAAALLSISSCSYSSVYPACFNAFSFMLHQNLNNQNFEHETCHHNKLKNAY
jgi:hypothetical protein